MVPLSRTSISLELCSLLTAENALSLNLSQNQNVFSIFHGHKMHNSPLRQGISDRNDRFCYPFIHFNYWNPYPFLQYRPENGTPLGRSLPVWAITKRITLIFRRVPRPSQSETNPCFKPIFLIFRCLCFTRMTRRGKTKTRGGLWEGKVKNRGSLHF